MATVMHQGRKVIAVSGTAVALASVQELNFLCIKAPKMNKQIIFIGSSTVTGWGTTVATTDGYMLNPGEQVKLSACDLADVFIEGFATDCVYWTGGSG